MHENQLHHILISLRSITEPNVWDGDKWGWYWNPVPVSLRRPLLLTTWSIAFRKYCLIFLL